MDLLERPLEDELALFDVQRGVVHTLNPSATVVWHALAESDDETELVEALQKAFGIDAAEAGVGVDEALRQFADSSLLEMEEEREG